MSPALHAYRMHGALGSATHWARDGGYRPGFEYLGHCGGNALARAAIATLLELPPLHWFTSTCGRVELCMALAQAQSVAGAGQQDDNVRALSEVPGIAEQLAAIDPGALSLELREYGAWDAEELEDHAQNLQRVLWLAGCDIAEHHVHEEGCPARKRPGMPCECDEVQS